MPNATARFGAAAAIALAIAVAPAGAQTLYKWVDDSGKTQYSDKPPKAFKGQFGTIDAGVVFAGHTDELILTVKREE